LFVTLYTPDPNGNGGNHRSYQILYDLQDAFGSENVTYTNYNHWYRGVEPPASPDAKPVKPRKTWVERLRDKVQLRTKWRSVWKEWRNQLRLFRRLKLNHVHSPNSDGTNSSVEGEAVFRILKNPLEDNVFRSVYSTHYETNRYSRTEFTRHYRSLLKQHEPDVVVIEHSGFIDVIDHNKKHGIPTIICPQNLDALDLTDLPTPNQWTTHARLYDLASELTVFERCERRLFISKVEAGFVQGMGFASDFYPYRAVGEIRERMLQVRQERAAQAQTRGLFLLIGSAHFPPIGDGLRWFAEEAAVNGLPEGVRVVAVGRGTEKLLAPSLTPAALELKGWTEQEELEQLLRQVEGILVPYRMGFGALTRLSELPVSGIPIIASEFATRGLESIDGIFPVANHWRAWCDAIEGVMSGNVATVTQIAETDTLTALEIAVRELVSAKSSAFKRHSISIDPNG
jgi:hypothetical protein